MGSASAAGENRASEAIRSALDSPLLNDNHIKGAKNVLLLIVSGKEEITIDEIGEINDFIQAEAGNSANIIMGIGDDESLGEEISVTIVATGFAPDQQVQVIGQQPNKVVHTLEDEQPVSASVFSKPLAQEKVDEHEEDDFINKELAKHSAKQEKKQFQQPDLFAMDSLEEEDEMEEEPQFEAPVAPEEAPLPPSMKEEEVVVEIPQQETPEPMEEPVAEQEEEEPVFHIGSIEVEDEEDEEIVHFSLNEEEDEEIAPTPQAEEKEQPPVVETPKEEAPKPMESPAPQREVKPIRYSLEDYMNLEQQLKSAKPGQTPASAPKSTVKVDEEKEDDSLRFEIKQVNKPEQPAPKANVEPKRVASPASQVSPTEYTIEESMRLKAEERRLKLKAFNYRFKNNPFGTDEVANEPAYKRQGVKIEDTRYSTESSVSRFSIDDSENGPDIKTNNSFLHDNVD